MANYTTMSLSATKYLCGLVRDLASVSEGVDDLHLASNSTFSSVKIDTLIKQCLQDSNDYTDRLVANLSRLELKIATSESEITQPNTMYLYKPSGSTSYEQYVVIEGTKVLLGTTDINMGDYYTITQADAKFVLKTDFDSLKTEIDKKVNKTDIVDNLTSTDTDKPLSANQGKVLKDELNLKANDSEVVKKTDISTTIDSTSTNDTVPSTKAIYDDTLVYRKVSNIDCEEGSWVTQFTTTPTSENGTFPVNYGWQKIEQFKAKDFVHQICTLYTSNGKVKEMYVRFAWCNVTKIENAVWTKWQKVCTTSVADVPRTIITNNLASTKVSLSNSDSFATYYVKNGTCYVTIWSMTIRAACSVETIFNDLPKSAIGATCPLCNGEESFAQVFISPNSNVIAFNASAATINKNGYCSFSYPVAES